jgi:hypothetical protein
MTLPAYPIVERLNVVGNVYIGELSVLVDPLLDSFLLQAAEEGFSDRIIPTVPSSAHARFVILGDAIAIITR